jgi:hypothetical protein
MMCARRLVSLGGALACLLVQACGNPEVIGGPGTDEGSGGASGKAGSSGKGGAAGNGGPGFNLPDASPMASSGGNGGGKSCFEESFVPERVPPEIIVVMDRSNTMAMPVMPSGNTRLGEVSLAIDDVVKQTEAKVFWGLKYFGGGCEVPDAPEVPVAGMNYATMSSTLKTTMAITATYGTPMAIAVRKAVEHLRSRTTPNPKYIVLGTDGLPNCGISPADNLPHRSITDTAGAVKAIGEARAAGFHTFVVGIAVTDKEGMSAPGLNMMADAGGEARMANPHFYPVNNRAELVQVLGDITVAVSTCIYPLSKPPPDPKLVQVTVEGKKAANDPTNGWSLGPDMMSVVLNGAACEQVKAVRGRDPEVKVTFGCYVP